MDYLGYLEQFDWKLERMRKNYGDLFPVGES